MVRLRFLAACALACSWACRPGIPARAPTTSEPTAPSPAASPPAAEATAERALGACKNEDFSSCEYACDDVECFGWCAGEACVAALEQVVACMEPTREALAEAATLEAQDQIDEAEARYVEYDRHWLDVCAPRCRQIIHDDCERGICEDYWCDFGPRIGFEAHVAQLLRPAASDDGSATADESQPVSGWGQSTLTLLGVNRADAKELAVSRLIGGDVTLAREVGLCVANPRPAGTRVTLSVHVARDGAPDRIGIESSEAPAAEACIRRRMQSFRLPRRVAEGFSDLRVELSARPDAGGFGAVGGVGDPWPDVSSPPRKFAPPPPTAEELQNESKLEAGCKQLLATAPTIGCAQAASLAEAVYGPLQGAGETVRTVERVNECVSRLADLTVRCADDPDFAKVVERLIKKK